MPRWITSATSGNICSYAVPTHGPPDDGSTIEESKRGSPLGRLRGPFKVAPTTARRWTLDIDVTADQLEQINARRIKAALEASTANATRWRLKRLACQRAGRLKAREGDRLHLAGCLLYWAEGTKTRNTVELANSDIHLIHLFLRFLGGCFEIGPGQLAFSLHVYTGNGLSIEEIEARWLIQLALPRSCAEKALN